MRILWWPLLLAGLAIVLTGCPALPGFPGGGGSKSGGGNGGEGENRREERKDDDEKDESAVPRQQRFMACTRDDVAAHYDFGTFGQRL